jgi:hypothetical protein
VNRRSVIRPCLALSDSNYFGGQLREIEADALSDALERRYRRRIDARATYADTMVRSVEEA